MLNSKLLLKVLVVSLCVCVCGAFLAACKDNNGHSEKATFDEAGLDSAFANVESASDGTEETKSVQQEDSGEEVTESSNENKKPDNDDNPDGNISIVTGSDDEEGFSSKSAVNPNEGSKDKSKKSIGDFPEYEEREITAQDYANSDLFQERIAKMRSEIDSDRWSLTYYVDEDDVFVFSYNALLWLAEDEAKDEFNKMVGPYFDDVDALADEIKEYTSSDISVIKFRAQNRIGNVISEKICMR